MKYSPVIFKRHDFGAIVDHYQKCGHRVVCSIRVFKMDFHVIKLSIVAYP